MEKIEIYLTHEDAVILEYLKSESAEQNIYYKTMTVSEYAEILLHQLLSSAVQK